VHVLDSCLRLLHPYMPYVTEELWSGTGQVRQHIASSNADAAMIITSAYPAPGEAWHDDEAERELSLVQEIVRAVRNLRRERNIDAGRWIEAFVVAEPWLARHAPDIEQLARVGPLKVVQDRGEAPSDSVATAVLDGAVVVLPMAGLFDATAERANLEKQRDQAQGEVGRLETQLGNASFVNNAKPEVVASARERLEAAKARLEGLQTRLRELG